MVQKQAAHSLRAHERVTHRLSVKASTPLGAMGRRLSLDDTYITLRMQGSNQMRQRAVPSGAMDEMSWKVHRASTHIVGLVVVNLAVLQVDDCA